MVWRDLFMDQVDNLFDWLWISVVRSHIYASHLTCHYCLDHLLPEETSIEASGCRLERLHQI